MVLTLADMTIRLVAALLCGAAIGWERRRMYAGMRVFAIVAVGSCIYMLTSCYGFKDILEYHHIDSDPGHIAAGVVEGIGFLGAGIILHKRKREDIKGLSTAGGVWTSAAIGLACGGGLYWLGVMGTVFVLIVQIIGRKIENRSVPDHHHCCLSVRLDPAAGVEAIDAIKDLVHQSGTKLHAEEHMVRKAGGVSIRLTVAAPDKAPLIDLMKALLVMENVAAVKYADLD